jgi:hypothetical protein
VDRKPKLYDTETIARAKRVQADVDELRSRVDALRAGGRGTRIGNTADATSDERIADCLYQLYASLGDHADVVANTLGAMGVVGVVMDSECCPLANLGYLATGVPVHVIDGAYAIGDKYGRYVWYDLPRAAATMIRAFDAGDYPWLEREPQGDEGAVQLAMPEGQTHVI